MCRFLHRGRAQLLPLPLPLGDEIFRDDYSGGGRRGSELFFFAFVLPLFSRCASPLDVVGLDTSILTATSICLAYIGFVVFYTIIQFYLLMENVDNLLNDTMTKVLGDIN